jgi:hypothetical protein
MAYQPCHSEGTHKNENAIKNAIVQSCSAGLCDDEGRTVPVEKRKAGKGHHFIANQKVGLMSTPDEIIARMRRAGILPKKERKQHAK